ncbi:hypothetical protein AK88_04580 [Plasmodium fragile]|uniref:Uncharacterized protein n=1 Tax=Plasmodium fragile TaxID=5857 RepID=A0A0D9QFI6_PLAFR|nr:uncharacterized protein AK88_04580 [Plasmodium fragile]KJP85764.1 hypothetical protein AK88_04580 [Plasmodium fragile]
MNECNKGKGHFLKQLHDHKSAKIVYKRNEYPFVRKRLNNVAQHFKKYAERFIGLMGNSASWYTHSHEHSPNQLTLKCCVGLTSRVFCFLCVQSDCESCTGA